MASVEVSINQLPTTNQIADGDFLIVQTPNATNRLNFSDFVVGLDNTTFKNTIETNTTDIDALSSNVETNTTDIDALSSNVETLSSNIETNTTDIDALTSNVETLSGTFYSNTPDINAGQSTHSIPITINGVNYAIMLSATS
jgi:outer membrane murein-binding lipoprotein Lpp